MVPTERGVLHCTRLLRSFSNLRSSCSGHELLQFTTVISLLSIQQLFYIMYVVTTHPLVLEA